MLSIKSILEEAGLAFPGSREEGDKMLSVYHAAADYVAHQFASRKGLDINYNLGGLAGHAARPSTLAHVIWQQNGGDAHVSTLEAEKITNAIDRILDRELGPQPKR